MLFFDRVALEAKYDMAFSETSFLSVADLYNHITARQNEHYAFQDIIGAGGVAP